MSVSFSKGSITSLPKATQNLPAFRFAGFNAALNSRTGDGLIAITVSTMAELFAVMKEIAQLPDDANSIRTHFDTAESKVYVWKI